MSTAVDSELKPSTNTFRIVLLTQCWEWYGDTPTCGRWKAKGGNEYHIRPGMSVQDVLQLGNTGLERLVQAALATLKTECPQEPGCHEGYEEFHSWELLSTDEESYEEQLAREYGETHISRIINV